MDEEEIDSHSTLYNRMVNHLGDYITSVREEEDEEKSKSLFKSLESINQRYRNDIPLAKGGMKEIFRVDDLMTGRPVAKAVIKNLRSKEIVEQFIQEARLTARLEHPNIMPVYDIGIDEMGQAFFTMKLVEGDNLGDIIKGLRKREPEYMQRYPLAVLLNIYTKVCDAVAFAHDKGVLHLDLKPDNIQVGEFGEVLVCDWGLSRFKAEIMSDDHEPIEYLEGQLTLHGRVFGSPGFMSPEQVTKGREELDHRSDIYSLGCILYTLLTLSPPYKGRNINKLLSDTSSGKFEVPSKNAGSRFVPSALEAVCLHAMQFNRSNRYNRVSEIKQEVNNFINGFATNAERAGAITQIYLFCRRHKGLVALGSVLITVSIFFTVIYLNKEKENKKVVEKLDEKEKERIKASQEKEAIKKKLDQFEVDSILRAKKNMMRLANSSFRAAINSVMRRDFAGAAESFSRVADEDLSEYTKVCRTLAEGFLNRSLPEEPLLEIIRLLNRDFYLSVIVGLLKEESKYLTMPQKKQLSGKVLKIMNPECRLNMNIYQFLGKTYVSLAESKGLKNISALALFKIHALDLSDTEVADLEVLRDLPISSLNLSNSSIEDLHPVAAAPLQTLNISYSKVKDIGFLKKETLENLDIRGLEIGAENISGFKALKTVSVSEGNKLENLELPFKVEVLNK